MERLNSLGGEQATKNMLIKPCHIIQIGAYVNDTYLPGLMVDLEERTLHLDWKELFSLFFTEEKCFLTACQDWVSRKTSSCGLLAYSPTG